MLDYFLKIHSIVPFVNKWNKKQAGWKKNKAHSDFLQVWKDVNSHGTRRMNPHGTRWQCTTKTFIMAFSILLGENWHELCISSAQKFDLWSENVISGQFSVHFLWNFRQNFIAPKDSSLNFRGRSLELFVSYRAHFRRYQHLRRFWQSTASSYRDCSNSSVKLSLTQTLNFRICRHHQRQHNQRKYFSALLLD